MSGIIEKLREENAFLNDMLENAHNRSRLLEQQLQQAHREGWEQCQRGAALRYTPLIEQLWQIIDDIDTYGDMAKADDKLFRSLVERRQKDRWATGIGCDGFTLDLNIAPMEYSGQAND